MSAELGIYDLDDALQWDERKGLVGAIRNRYEKTVSCIRAADRVIAGNEDLAEFAAMFCDDVVLIPSCVNPNAYNVKRKFEVHDPPLIGWIGSPSGEPYLLGIGAALLEFNRRTGCRLQIIGGRAGSLGTLESIVDRIVWTEAVAERLPATWDVGIMPIADTKYERGKCGYKLLQYAASGLPSVASPVGVNKTICKELGFSSAVSSQEWIDVLTALVEAPDAERQETGNFARAGVTKMYSYGAWKNRWLSAVEQPTGQI